MVNVLQCQLTLPLPLCNGEMQGLFRLNGMLPALFYQSDAFYSVHEAIHHCHRQDRYCFQNDVGITGGDGLSTPVMVVQLLRISVSNAIHSRKYTGTSMGWASNADVLPDHERYSPRSIPTEFRWRVRFHINSCQSPGYACLIRRASGGLHQYQLTSTALLGCVHTDSIRWSVTTILDFQRGSNHSAETGHCPPRLIHQRIMLPSGAVPSASIMYLRLLTRCSHRGLELTYKCRFRWGMLLHMEQLRVAQCTQPTSGWLLPRRNLILL